MSDNIPAEDQTQFASETWDLWWRMIRLIGYNDGTLQLRFPQDEVSDYAAGSMDGDELVNKVGSPEGPRDTIDPTEWQVVNVLPRGRKLYETKEYDYFRIPRRGPQKNLFKQMSIPPHGEPFPDEYWEDGQDRDQEGNPPNRPRKPEPVVTGIYMGWSLYMRGPVLIKPVRTGPTSPTNRLQVEEANFEGNEFKVEPGGSAMGIQTIPHFLMTMPGNLKAAKKWVAGQAFSRTYMNGQHSLGQIRSHTNKAARALAIGGTVVPVAKYLPLTDEDFEVAKRTLSRPLRDNHPAGPANPPRSELICDAALLRRKRARNSGFQYSVPYIKALKFPPELTKMLQKFAMEFPNDILTMDCLYLATFAWYDITVSPSRKREPSINVIGRKAEGWTVPRASLAECLIYYQHWLRWVEVMGLVEYPHLFRYVARAVHFDRARLPLVVKENLIDESRVKYLMTLVTTRANEVTPSMRLLVLPHMLKDSSMPQMINMEPYQKPNLQQLILTGLPSVLLCGTPNYVGIEESEAVTHTIPLCIPSTLADNSFHGPHSPLVDQQWTLEGLLMGKPDQLSLITAPKICAGPVWCWDPSEIARMNEAPYTQGPPRELIDPGWSVLESLGLAQQSFFLHHQRHWLNRLVVEGIIEVKEGYNLHINDQGMITAVECALLTEEELKLPPPEMISGEGGRERIEAEAGRMEGPLFAGEEELEGPSPHAVAIMEGLAGVSSMKCTVWREVQQTLNEMPSGLRTSETLIGLLKPAIRDEQMGSFLEMLGGFLTPDDQSQVNSDEEMGE